MATGDDTKVDFQLQLKNAQAQERYKLSDFGQNPARAVSGNAAGAEEATQAEAAWNAAMAKANNVKGDTLCPNPS